MAKLFVYSGPCGKRINARQNGPCFKMPCPVCKALHTWMRLQPVEPKTKSAGVEIPIEGLI